MSVGQDLLNVPFPQMVESMGMAIARAQTALDMHSMKMAQIMSGAQWIDHDDSGEEVVREGVKVLFGGRWLSLMELGFTPTFYQFVDTVIEVKISVSMRQETEDRHSSSSTQINTQARFSWWSSSASASMSVSTVSASFAARNSYSSEGASLIRTKLVPLPPPAILQDRIKSLMEEQKAKQLSLDLGIVEMVKKGHASASQKVPIPAEGLEDITVFSTKESVVKASYSASPPAIQLDAQEEAGVATVVVRAKKGKGDKAVPISGEFKVTLKIEVDS